MRKAQISINVTWVFAIIAGLIVMAMIFGFGDTASQQTELQTNIQVLENLDTQLTSAANTRGTFQEMNVPDMEIQNLCEDPETSGFLVEGAQSVQEKPHQAIFSMRSLTGDTLYAWTQDWQLPKRVDRFLYLSDKETLFIVVRDRVTAGQTPEYEKFLEDFPDGFELAVVNYTNLTYYGNTAFEKYRIIFFNEDQGRVRYFDQNRLSISGQISAVNIQPEDGYGTVDFYQLNKNGMEGPVTTSYVGDPLLYGAVFSQSLRHYDCNREKAYDNLQEILSVEYKRALDIQDERAGGDASCKVEDPEPRCGECLAIWNDIPGILQTMNESAENPNPSSAQILAENADELRKIEDDLAKGSLCPTM